MPEGPASLFFRQGTPVKSGGRTGATFEEGNFGVLIIAHGEKEGPSPKVNHVPSVQPFHGASPVIPVSR